MVENLNFDVVIIGGGPAGTQAATVAARLGAQVTLIERDVVGGAAHLWDCVPSKAMIAVFRPPVATMESPHITIPSVLRSVFMVRTA